MQNFKVLTGLCRGVDWLEPYLVRNSKDRFSCIKAYIYICVDIIRALVKSVNKAK